MIAIDRLGEAYCTEYVDQYEHNTRNDWFLNGLFRPHTETLHKSTLLTDSENIHERLSAAVRHVGFNLCLKLFSSI